MPVVTPNQITNSVYKSISDSVIKSMQLAQSQVFTTQDININCDSEAVASMASDVQYCIDQLLLKKASIDVIKKLCKPAINCSGTNISIKSSLNVTNIMSQTAQIQSNIQNTLSNNITQDLSTLNSALKLGSKSDTTTLESITNQITSNTQNITQSVQDSVTAQQGLNLDNYQANNVTINNIATVITNTVQNIKGVQDNITKLSNSIIQQLSTNTDSLTTWVTKIMLWALGIIVLMFFILYVLKRQDTREFVQFITPYVIFVIGVFIIVGAHSLFKPGYVLEDENATVKVVSSGKFIFWCAFYSIILGTIEIVYYRIYSRKKMLDK